MQLLDKPGGIHVSDVLPSPSPVTADSFQIFAARHAKTLMNVKPSQRFVRVGDVSILLGVTAANVPPEKSLTRTHRNALIWMNAPISPAFVQTADVRIQTAVLDVFARKDIF